MPQRIDCQIIPEIYTDSLINELTFVLEYDRGDDGKIAKAWATNIAIYCDGELSLITGLKIDLIHHDDLDVLRTLFKGLDLEKMILANI